MELSLHVDAIIVLCTQLTSDLFVVAKFLVKYVLLVVYVWLS